MRQTPSPSRLDMFGLLERLNGPRPWGRMLDAGSGMRSALWARGLGHDGWLGVTADQAHLAEIRRALPGGVRPGEGLLLGNWRDPGLLAGQRFETVLAEYLLGAIEAHAPGFQTGLFRRLRPHVAGRLLFVGLEPYVLPETPAPSEAAALLAAIGETRDAALILARQRPYREFPAEWVIDMLEGSGFRILSAERYPNAYGPDWLVRQEADTAAALRGLEPALAAALMARMEGLLGRARAEIARAGALQAGHDHVIIAEPR